MNISQILATGLQKGFAGETEFKSTERAGFQLQSSHFQDGEAVYHDEWAANRVGGGQELVTVGEQSYTRVYAGGTISEARLAELKISKADIMKYLIQCLNESGEQTRGETDFGPRTDGQWRYEYQVWETNPNIPLTTGKESIFYQDQLVFVHVFVMCPVE